MSASSRKSNLPVLRRKVMQPFKSSLKSALTSREASTQQRQCSLGLPFHERFEHGEIRCTDGLPTERVAAHSCERRALET